MLTAARSQNIIEPGVRRVFVVEDDHFYETVIKRVLQSIDIGMRVDWVGSAERAIERLRQLKKQGRGYDLIIADIFLSGEYNGFDLWTVCRELYPDTPIVLTSGLTREKFEQIAGPSPFAPPFLQKPFDPPECKELLESFLIHGT